MTHPYRTPSCIRCTRLYERPHETAPIACERCQAELISGVQRSLEEAMENPGVIRCVNAKCWCKGRRYTCPTCKRFVPECFGGAPDPRCDACWTEPKKETANV